MGRVAAAAALLLVLTGCSTQVAPQPGLTGGELSALRQQQSDLAWQRTGVSDALRPPAPEVHYVTGEEWARFLADCMNVAGFDNYTASGGGLGTEFVVRPADEAQREVISFYLCQSAVALEGQDDFWFNPAEVEYSYDYYQEVLIPCLASHGVVVFQAPTWSEFVDANGQWNPYFAVSSATKPRLVADDSILAECPATPPGMTDWGITAEYFTR